MKGNSKEETVPKIGEHHRKLPILNGGLQYVAGVDDFNAKRPGPLFIYKHERGLNIEMIAGLSKLRAAIPDEAIKRVSIENREKIAEKKSSLGRAVVGGVLLGPLGAALGAVTAKSGSATVADFFLIIEHNTDGLEDAFVAHIDSKHASRAEDFFKANYSDKYTLQA